MADRRWGILAFIVAALCAWFLVAELPFHGMSYRQGASTTRGRLAGPTTPRKLAAKLGDAEDASADHAMVRPTGTWPAAAGGIDASGPAVRPPGLLADGTVAFPQVPEGMHSVWPATAQGIQGAIEEAKPLLRECYQGWQFEDPDLAGEVVVRLTVSADDTDPTLGVISEAIIEDTTVEHAWMEACVLSVLSEVEFEDPPSSGLVITYPLTFDTVP